MSTNTIYSDDNNIIIYTDGDSGKIYATDNDIIIYSNASNISLSSDNYDNITLTYNPIPPNTNTYFSEKYVNLPSATGNNDRIVQYIGDTDDVYINGYFYKSNGNEWKPIPVQSFDETDPVFSTWKNASAISIGAYAEYNQDIICGDAPICIGGYSSASGTYAISIGAGSKAIGGSACAIGSRSYASGDVLAFPYTESQIKLNSKVNDTGKSSYTLKSLFDNKANSSDVYTKTESDNAFSRLYRFKTFESNVITAESSYIYDLTMTSDQATSGLVITLPQLQEYTQDFIIRLDTTAGATQITSITQTADDGTALSFDWPRGNLMATGSLTADVYYISFTQVGLYRWNIGYYKANA